MNMNFYMPTKVIMGIGCVKQQGEAFKQLGSKAIIVTGKYSAKANGSLADVTKTLEKARIDYTIYDKVMSNPSVDCAYEGAELAKEFGAEFVISIGGGSPMDAGKAVAMLAVQEIPREELFQGVYEDKVLPMVHIPTTAGTGSEVTQYAILTNDRAQTKTSIATPILFPTLALLDPIYMESLGRITTIHTTIDALSHAVEGMLSVRSTPMTDALAVESIKNIVSCYDSLKKGKLTIDERGKLLYASMLAGIVIAHTGTTAVHSLGYSLTYFRDIDHGRANGLLMGAFFRFIAKIKPEEINRILDAMDLVSINRFEAWIDELLGEKETVTGEEMEKFTEIAMNAKNLTNSKVPLVKTDVLELYKHSFKHCF